MPCPQSGPRRGSMIRSSPTYSCLELQSIEAGGGGLPSERGCGVTGASGRARRAVVVSSIRCRRSAPRCGGTASWPRHRSCAGAIRSARRRARSRRLLSQPCRPGHGRSGLARRDTSSSRRSSAWPASSVTSSGELRAYMRSGAPAPSLTTCRTRFRWRARTVRCLPARRCGGGSRPMSWSCTIRSAPPTSRSRARRSPW